MDQKILVAVKEYGLTPKEADVFSHLARGSNAKEIARYEGLTYETTRWYIKQIYQKFGVNKQTEIMRLFID